MPNHITGMYRIKGIKYPNGLILNSCNMFYPLSWTGKHLNKAPLLAESFQNRYQYRPFEHCDCSNLILLNVLSKIAHNIY